MLDRDELAARCLVASLGHAHYSREPDVLASDAVECADALLARLRPVAPASGAPATDPRRTVGAVVRWRGQDHPDEEWLLVGNNKAVALKIRKPHLLDCGTNPDGGGDEFVRWATREECERHGLNYVARPLPGAPIAAPSRPEWVRITGLNEGSKGYLTVGKVYRVTGWGHRDCPQVTNDMGHDYWALSSRGVLPDPEAMTFASWEPCAAPSPAAKPWTWRAKPEVGDVWVHPLAPETEVIITTSGGGLTLSAGKNFPKGDFTGVGPASSDGAFGWYYLRRATSSERAAAGLPVDESATKPVDREGLVAAMNKAARLWVESADKRSLSECHADAAIAFMAKGPAFDRAEFNEAQEREAALGVWRTTVGGLPDNFVEGWLARARVAAKGGA